MHTVNEWYLTVKSYVLQSHSANTMHYLDIYCVSMKLYPKIVLQCNTRKQITKRAAKTGKAKKHLSCQWLLADHLLKTVRAKPKATLNIAFNYSPLRHTSSLRASDSSLAPLSPMSGFRFKVTLRRPGIWLIWGVRNRRLSFHAALCLHKHWCCRDSNI